MIDNLQIDIDNRTETPINDDFCDTVKSAVSHTLKEFSLTGVMEVSVSFVEPEEIKILNGNYRNIPEATDVLSFPMYPDFKTLQETSKEQAVILGDIVLSLEAAKQQADTYGHSLNREIYYLTVHSMLHLLGYDHIDDEDRLRMRHMEKTIMSTSAYANDYDEEG